MTYADRVRELEAEGMTTSDAQSVADAEGIEPPMTSEELASEETFPIARELLAVELERLERDHYSEWTDTSCDGCLRAAAARREMEALA